MNLSSPTILLPALRSLLANRLQKAAWLQYENFQISLLNCVKSTPFEQEASSLSLEIPLNRTKDTAQVCYTSAIALKLASLINVPATEIALCMQALLSTLIENPGDSASHLPIDRVWANFSIQVLRGSWINLQLNQQGLAEWLQILVTQPLSLSSSSISWTDFENYNQSFQNSSELFLSQYTHARCCSLLRSAEQDGLVELGTSCFNPTSVRKIIVAPQPLPWLNLDNTLRLNRSVELELINQLVATLDDLVRLWHSKSKGLIASLAYRLSQCFQAFYADCRIWGKTKMAHRELAQSRLGLVLATQSVLRLLLEDLLGVAAPQEL